MANFDGTLEMLREIYKCGRNPLHNFVHKFAVWAETEEGCWWWVKEGAKGCLKRRIIYYHGGSTRLKKEKYVIQELPFNDLKDTAFMIYKELLIEKWLKFINQDEGVKKMMNKNYDNVTDPRF